MFKLNILQQFKIWQNYLHCEKSVFFADFKCPANYGFSLLGSEQIKFGPFLMSIGIKQTVKQDAEKVRN